MPGRLPLLLMTAFSELVSGVWRYDAPGAPERAGAEGADAHLAPNAIVIVGTDGWLLVDVPADPAVVAALLRDNPAGERPCLGLIATSGSRLAPEALAEVRRSLPAVPIYLHESAQAEGLDGGTPGLGGVHRFSSVQVFDLGERRVEAIHPGRAGTSDAVVVNLPGDGVLLLGDLLPGGAPGSGFVGDSADGPSRFTHDVGGFPTDWPTTLDLVLTLTTPTTLILPGHGLPITRVEVEDARDSMVIAGPEFGGGSGGPPIGDRLQLPLV